MKVQSYRGYVILVWMLLASVAVGYAEIDLGTLAGVWFLTKVKATQ